MDTLRQTTPHFVRCVNPNQFKRPQMFDAEYVRPQLRCGGIIEALRVLKLGYPSRVPYADIHGRFGHLLKHSPSSSHSNQKDFAEAVFLAFGLDPKEYQLGLTKVFFRPGKQEFLETVLSQADSSSISPDTIRRIASIMVRKRLRRAVAGVKLLNRFMRYIKTQRAYRRITDFAGMVTMVTKVLKWPLYNVYRGRAALTLQASLKARVAVMDREKLRRGAGTIVRYACFAFAGCTV